MTSIKNKLLSLVDDTNIDEMETSRLVDLLADKIKLLEKEKTDLRVDILLMQERMQHERDHIKTEARAMRCDPTYWAAGEYCFSLKDYSADVLFQVRNGTVKAYFVNKDVWEALPRIPFPSSKQAKSHG